jgi:hypothetical protein
MSKTEVYSWRVDPTVKAALEQAARSKGTSVARPLDRIVQDWLGRELPPEEEMAQRWLHAAAARTFGAFRSGDPDGSEQVRERVRTRVRQRPIHPA